MPILTSQLANIVSETFFGAQETTLIADSANETRQTTLLKFLAAGVQVVPEDICCIMASQLVRLVEKTTTSHSVKTLAYLTLEVMYASRKLTSQGDHIDSILRSLFENMELPDVEELGQQDKDEDMVGVTNTFANNQSEQRVVAYIQATAQVCLNYSSLQKTSVFNEYI